MRDDARKPSFLTQNRLEALLASRAERVAFYARVLDRRIAEAGRGVAKLRVPRPEGLRRRIAGKPFHADPEIFFQESGVLRFELPGEAFALRAGDAALIPAGMPHGEAWSGRFLNLIFMVQPDGFSLHLGYLKGGVRCGPADRFPAPAEVIVRYTEELAACVATNGHAALRQGLQLALLGRLREGLAQPTPGPAVGPPLLRRGQDLIEAHYARLDFSVAWLARELGCSPDHLSRAFRRHTGQRLIEFVHDRRLQQARKLLRESTMGVAEVAWACGFSRPSYFNRIFRQRMHVTPRVFRVRKIGANPVP
jgi:AraC-like DNA-binding protein